MNMRDVYKLAYRYWRIAHHFGNVLEFHAEDDSSPVLFANTIQTEQHRASEMLHISSLFPSTEGTIFQSALDCWEAEGYHYRNAMTLAAYTASGWRHMTISEMKKWQPALYEQFKKIYREDLSATAKSADTSGEGQGDQ